MGARAYITRLQCASVSKPQFLTTTRASIFKPTEKHETLKQRALVHYDLAAKDEASSGLTNAQMRLLGSLFNRNDRNVNANRCGSV
jgi:hypothetical protein